MVSVSLKPDLFVKYLSACRDILPKKQYHSVPQEVGNLTVCGAQSSSSVGFWRGNTLTVIKTIPQAAIQFAAYDGVKDILMSISPRDAAEGMSQVNHLLLFTFIQQMQSCIEKMHQHYIIEGMMF